MSWGLMRWRWARPMTERISQHSKLRVTGAGVGLYRTTAPWSVYTSRYSRIITVESGFVFDGDSVPRLPLVYMLAKGRAGLQAPALHDWVYAMQPQGITRRIADVLYWDMMRATGVRLHWALIHFIGVRIGGWVSWRRYRRRLKRKEARRG